MCTNRARFLVVQSEHITSSYTFHVTRGELGLCLGWKGQLICWREGREGKGGWGREGG